MLKRTQREKLLKNSRGEYNYHFNWISGGFNDVWAKNLIEFKKEIKKRFGSEACKEVNYNTLRKVTSIESKELDKLSNMMFW
jgi:hypothetical protein